MTPQQALCMLYAADSWQALLKCADRASVAVDLHALHGQDLKKLDNIPSSFIDTRYI